MSPPNALLVGRVPLASSFRLPFISDRRMQPGWYVPIHVDLVELGAGVALLEVATFEGPARG